MRVTLRDGSFREVGTPPSFPPHSPLVQLLTVHVLYVQDVGYGEGTNPGRAAAIEKAKKVSLMSLTFAFTYQELLATINFKF